MIREIFPYKAVLNSYASENCEVLPTHQEWLHAESICDFLKAFEEATRGVSLLMVVKYQINAINTCIRP